MTASMTRAWAVGIGILTVAYAAWFISLQTSRYSETLVFLLWISPLVAALVAAYFAPRKQIFVGVSMALPSAVFAVALNFVYQSLGNAVDFPGGWGGLILFVTTLAYSVIACGVGAIGGSLLSKKFRQKGQRVKVLDHDT